MSAKNKYDRIKNVWVVILCIIALAITITLAIISSSKNATAREPYKNELSSLKSDVSSKKEEVSSLSKELETLQQQKDFIENSIKDLEDNADFTTNTVAQFNVGGKVYYCFRDTHSLENGLSKCLQKRGFAFPKDSIFEISKNWSSNTSYETNLKSNMKLYRMPYVFSEEIKSYSHEIDYNYILWYLDTAENTMYRETLYFMIKVGS